jgi:type IV pilus assembly protein PilO
MTMSDDFMPGDPAFETAPDYPVVFGISLTPTISGVLLALVGIGGAAYLLLNLVQPEWQKYQELSAKVNEKKEQVTQQAAIQRQVDKAKADLEAAKRQREEVTKLFANEATLKTLLLDFNREVEKTNTGVAAAKQAKLATCPPAIRNNLAEFEKQYGELATQAKLRKFVPVVREPSADVVKDGAYGSAVDGKLKRQTVNVELEGNFNQTQSILRRVEQLQPLLVLRDVKFTLPDVRKFDVRYIQQGNVLRPDPNCQVEPKLTTTFQLEALLPLSSEEVAKTTPPPK